MTPPPPRGLNALASAASSAATGASSGRNMAEDDASLDDLLGINDHHGAPEVQEVAPNKDPIEDAALDDVEFIDEDANEPQLPVQKAKRGQQPHLTKIKSILLVVLMEVLLLPFILPERVLMLLLCLLLSTMRRCRPSVIVRTVGKMTEYRASQPQNCSFNLD
jgi:hypothetical protein